MERNIGGVRSVEQTEDGQLLITLDNTIQTSSLPTKRMGKLVAKPTSEKGSHLNNIYG